MAARPDIQEIFSLHLKASQRRDELLEEVRALQAAGKIHEAKAKFRAAEAVQTHLEALENEVRPRPRRYPDRN